MAKLKHGIFGPLSGKIGPVVGGSWKGIPYVRQEQKETAPKKPRSAAQHANEEKMRFVNILLMPFHPYVTIGFQNLAIRQTAISAAYSHNFHHAITGVYPGLAVDYSKIMISKGELPGLNKPSVELHAADQLKISWQEDSRSGALYDDQLLLMLYCPELHIADGFIGGISRAAGATVFTFDQRLVGKPLEVYLGLTSLNRKKIADSVYMGRVQS